MIAMAMGNNIAATPKFKPKTSNSPKRLNLELSEASHGDKIKMAHR
jgi:hypothetical protein